MSIFVGDEKKDEKKEEEIVKRALAKNKLRKEQVQTEINAYRFFTIPDLIKNVRFQQPTVCYLQVVNCDKLDKDGFPTTTIHSVNEPRVVATKRHITPYKQKETIEIGEINIYSDLAVAVIKDQTYTLKYTPIYTHVEPREILYKELF